MLDLTCPNFQILIGSSDISLHVTGFSFRHPLAEISTPLIWTGQIEIDATVDTSLGASFFDDEINPSRWLSGLQPIDVYFEGVWWQRFRIKPSGYRYDQITGQSITEITDIIGILDSYQPAADAPELKVGNINYWNDLAVKMIQKQAQLMGRGVTVQTPPIGIGGIYRTPRTISGSYIKEAQKMAGERGYWMWSDKEVIKWAAYPEGGAGNIQWRKSRKELLVFSRQQGLDPVVQSVTVSATNEDIFDCQDKFPRTTTEFADRFLFDATGRLQVFQILKARKKIDRQITRDVYTFTTEINGSPSIYFFDFGAPTLPKEYEIYLTDPATNLPTFYRKKVNGFTYTYQVKWDQTRPLSSETDTTTYEAVPLESLNASKILKRVIRTEEILATNESALINLSPSRWFQLALKSQKTTEYTYREIKRDDIIVAQGVKLFEIDSITETEKRLFVKITKTVVAGVTTSLVVNFLEQVFQKTVSTYTKICQGRWREVVQTSKPILNSKTGGWTLQSAITKDDEVLSIPEITYRPAPFPIFQKPLLATAITGYAGISPFVQSRDFKSANTLTTTAEVARLARYYGRINWQRYYSREIAAGYETVLNYQPFQGVLAGNGAFIRDHFGVSLNYEEKEKVWQFVEDCIGNKTGSIAEIQAPPIPFPPLLTSTLNIGIVPNQSFEIGVPISISLSAAGGATPYTFSSVSLPSGLSISGNILSGAIASAGTTSVTITVTDNLGATDSTTFDIVVTAIVPVSITQETIVFETIKIQTFEPFFEIGLPIPFEIIGGRSQSFEPIIFQSFVISASSSRTDIIPLDPIASRSVNRVVFEPIEFRSSQLNRFDATGTIIDPPVSSLNDKIIAYWAFEDNADNLAVNELGDTNYDLSVTSSYIVTGKINSTIERIDSGLALSVPDPFWTLYLNNFVGFALYVFPDSNNFGTIDIVRSHESGSTEWGLYFDYDASPIQLIFNVNYAPISVDVTADEWYLIICEIDQALGTYTIQVNNNSKITGTIDPLNFGYAMSLEIKSELIDELFFFSESLNILDVADVYNSGDGNTYPF